jgi:hypothetical protein
VPESADEIIDRIFALAKADEEAGILANPLSEAHAKGQWDTAVLDRVLRELEEQR